MPGGRRAWGAKPTNAGERSSLWVGVTRYGFSLESVRTSPVVDDVSQLHLLWINTETLLPIQVEPAFEQLPGFSPAYSLSFWRYALRFLLQIPASTTHSKGENWWDQNIVSEGVSNVFGIYHLVVIFSTWLCQHWCWYCFPTNLLLTKTCWGPATVQSFFWIQRIQRRTRDMYHDLMLFTV